MKYLLLLLIAVSSVATADYKAQVWPDEFAVSFTESSFDEYFKGTTKAKIYYSNKLGLSRTYRDTGKYNTICGNNSTPKRADIPCQQIVTKDYRYVYHPTTNSCCMCCTTKQFCGLTRYDWVVGGKFNRQYKDKAGRQILEYNLTSPPAPPHNYSEVLNKDGSRTPYRDFHVPVGDNIYNPDDFKTDPLDASLFEAPSVCKPENLCQDKGACDFFRNMFKSPSEKKFNEMIAALM